MALNIRQFNDLRTSQKKTGSGVSLAKKMADLYVSTHTNEEGKVNDPNVYRIAIDTYLAPFSGDIDADNAIANYENSARGIAGKHAQNARAVGQMKIQERDIFFVTPRSANREDILGDLPTMVSQVTDELALHNLEVLRAIDIADANGDDTTELQNYLRDSQGRLNAMMELNNDLLTGEISPGQMQNEVGVFVDTDPDDGSVRGVGIMPTRNLPFGFSQDDYKRVEASTDIAGGLLPVYGNYTTNEFGEYTVNIAGNKWVGTGNMPLQFSKKDSVSPEMNPEGGFSLNNVSLNTPGIKPNRFFKGYTGFNEDGSPKEQYFYADTQGSLYTVSDSDLQSLRGDPTQAPLLKNATRVDSDYARNIAASPLKPYTSAPTPPPIVQSAAPGTAQQESGGFFKKAWGAVKGIFSAPEGEPVSSGMQTSTPAFFASRTNTPAAVRTPQEVGGALPTPDVVAGGQSFFRGRI